MNSCIDSHCQKLTSPGNSQKLSALLWVWTLKHINLLVPNVDLSWHALRVFKSAERRFNLTRTCVEFGRTLFTPVCYIAIFFQVIACVGMSRQQFVWDFPTSSNDRRPKMHTFFFISPLQRSTSVSTVLNLEHRPPTLSLCSWMYVCYFNSELRIDRLKGFQWHTLRLVQKTWRYPWKSTFTATEGLTGVSAIVLGHFVGTVGP